MKSCIQQQKRVVLRPYMDVELLMDCLVHGGRISNQERNFHLKKLPHLIFIGILFAFLGKQVTFQGIPAVYFSLVNLLYVNLCSSNKLPLPGSLIFHSNYLYLAIPFSIARLLKAHDLLSWHLWLLQVMSLHLKIRHQKSQMRASM